MLRPYERLSRLYDADWSDFAERCLPWVLSVLERRGMASARVLDLACGTGILALGLADAGHTVLGLDISREMIEIARRKAGSRTDVRFEVQDMRVLDLQDIRLPEMETPFDAATCTFDSLNYLVAPGDVGKVFCAVADVLCAEGVFLFDVNTERMYTETAVDPVRRSIRGEWLIQRLDYDPETRVARTIFEFEDGTTEIHPQRPYERHEIVHLLTEAGLRLTHVQSGLEKNRFRRNAPRLVCVAVKAR